MLVRLTSVVCFVKKRSNWYFLIADGWRGGGPTIEINTDKKPRRLLVRPIEAAEMLACSKAKVYELVKSGALPSVTLEDRRVIRIPLAALEKLASVPE